MSALKTILVILLPLLMAAAVNPGAQTVRWAVQANSNLQVQGSSNVNRFTCSINSIGACDTLNANGTAGGPVALRGCIKMNVMSFDCHNGLIQKDLRKTLKAEEYPKMTIRFLSLKKMPGLTRQPETISGWVEVELAGAKKVMEINYGFQTNAAGHILLNGARKFCFSDF